MSRNESKRRSRKASETGWVTRATMAAVFDVSAGGFDKSIRRFAPTEAIRGKGRRLRFYGRVLIEAWARHRHQALDDEAGANSKAPASPWLELFRQERWRSARLARLRQESQVVSASFMRDAMQVVVAMLTRAGTKLYDLHGEAAYEILEDAVGAISKQVDDMFAKGIEEDAAAADAEATDEDPDDEGM